jgi:hypothetical protein
MIDDKAEFKMGQRVFRFGYFEHGALKEGMSLELKPYDKNLLQVGTFFIDGTLIDGNMKRISLMDILRYPDSYLIP